MGVRAVRSEFWQFVYRRAKALPQFVEVRSKRTRCASPKGFHELSGRFQLRITPPACAHAKILT
jgi:hypothetical protein